LNTASCDWKEILATVLGVRQLLGFVVAVEPFELEEVHINSSSLLVRERRF
jgi:hypothetical protein